MKQTPQNDGASFNNFSRRHFFDPIDPFSNAVLKSYKIRYPIG
jgi:hypothetical protein